MSDFLASIQSLVVCYQNFLALNLFWILFRGNTIHYLLHGCHHKHPMDGLRLVFPPAATAILLFPVRLFCLIQYPFIWIQGVAFFIFYFIGNKSCFFKLLKEKINYVLNFEAFDIIFSDWQKEQLACILCALI